MGRGEVFQGVERLFRPALLHRPHHRVDDDDRQDQDRLKKILRAAFGKGDDERNRGGRQQDEDHYIFELI